MPESSFGVVNLAADSSAGGSIFSVVVARDAGNSFLPADPVADISRKPGPGTFGCHGNWVYQKSMGRHLATVGETYGPGNVAQQKFTYSKGQTSALGVGWSFHGDGGTFSDVGIMGESASFTEPWPTFGPDRSVFYRSMFHYGEYKCVVALRQVTGHLQAPNRNCIHQDAGSKPKSSNTSAVTWRRKLGLESALGFEATTETGFDTSAQLQLIYLHPGRLCGWMDPPGGHPRQPAIFNCRRCTAGCRTGGHTGLVHVSGLTGLVPFPDPARRSVLRHGLNRAVSPPGASALVITEPGQ